MRVLFFAIMVGLVVASGACNGPQREITTPSEQTNVPATSAPAAHVTTIPTAQATGQGETAALAYVSSADGALWVRAGDGKVTRHFAPENGYVYYPEWSPDGTKLAFTEVTFKHPGAGVGYADILSVVAIDENGSELVRVPRAVMPHWSPDSTHLSVLLEPNTPGEVFLATPSIVDVTTGSVRRLVQETDVLDSPRWDSTGRWLAYAAVQEGIVLIPVNGQPLGSSPLPLVQSDGYSKFYLSPMWSSDGLILAFERDRSEPAGSEADSYVVIDPKVGVTSRVPDSNPDKCGRSLWLRDGEAHWVPGTALAVWGRGCGTLSAGIWVKDMSGQTPDRLLDVSSVVPMVGEIDVSPDGRTMAFSTSGAALGIGRGAFPTAENSKLFAIYSIDLNGNVPQPLVAQAMHPAWQPFAK